MRGVTVNFLQQRQRKQQFKLRREDNPAIQLLSLWEWVTIFSKESACVFPRRLILAVWTLAFTLHRCVVFIDLILQSLHSSFQLLALETLTQPQLSITIYATSAV